MSITSRCSSIKKLATFLLPVHFLLLGSITQAALVGSTPGQFSVSPSGAATYTVPIQVPPGIAGMQPSLSLEYNSQADNGLLGIGWYLGGLSSITRCPTTLVQDGFIDGVDFDNNDKYCLDGQRLIVVNGGIYGADGTQYRTEIDSFNKITSHSAASIGIPAYFKVQSKSGQTLWYGGDAISTQGRFEAQGKTDVLTWAMNKVEDVSGNYLTITYTEDNPNGDYYPSRIDYTGNSISALSTHNSIQFTYQNNTFISETYISDTTQKTTKLLTSVNTYTGASLVKKYTLNYEIDSTPQRSQINSISECNSVNQCNIATKFDWVIQGQVSFNTTSKWASSYGSTWNAHKYYSTIRYPDLNDDGLPDICGRDGNGIQCRINTGSGFNPTTTWTGSYASWSSAQYYSTITYLDLNGDGLPDICGRDKNGIQCGINNGNGFNHTINWTSSYGAGWHLPQHYSTITYPDLNGDGLPDICGRDDSGIRCGINNGNGFNPTTYWTSTYGSGWNLAQHYSTINYPDLNGDGLPDICGRDDSGIRCGINNGNGFDHTTNWTSSYGSGWHLAQHYSTITYPDLNGDALADICGRDDGGIRCAISTGNSFNATVIWTPFYGSSWSDHMYYSTIKYPDLNGDGLPDICGRDGYGIHCGINTGSGFDSTTSWTSYYGSSWSSHEYYYGTITYLDLNGDSLPDICGRDGNGIHCGINNSRKHQSIISIEDSLGTQTNIQYKALTDDSVYSKGATTTYPIQTIKTPIYVVASNQSDNGIGSQLSTSYLYEGMKAHLTGRGNLGFEKITTTNNQSGIKSTTTYSQTYPYIGMPISSETRLANDQLLNKSTSTPLHHGVVGTGPVFPYISETVTQNYNFNSGVLLTTATTSNAYDTYGNLTNATTSTVGGGQTFTQQAVNTYNNDTVNWFLGQVTRTDITKTNPDTSSASYASAFEYDPVSGRMSKGIIEPDSLNPNLKLTTVYGYDSYGNTVNQTLCDGSINNCTPGIVGTRTTTTSYVSNSANYPDGLFATSVSNAMGDTETRIYDPAFGNVLSLTGPNGLTTTWEYDSLGRKSKETRADGTITNISYAWCDLSCPTIGGAAAKYTVTKQTVGLPTTVVYFDKLKRELRKQNIGFNGATVYKDTHYDSHGRVLKSSLPYYSSAANIHWTTPTYDVLNRQIQLTYPNGNGGFLNTYTTYNGLVTTQTDTKNRVTTQTKNAMGQVVQINDAVGNPIYYRYDALGNLIETKDGQNNIVALTYDARGRKATMNDPDMGAWSYTYNAFGELVSQTDAKGQVTTMLYDALGRVTQRIDDATGTPHTNTWVYGTSAALKNIGKLVSSDGQNGTAKSFTYDSLGRLSVSTFHTDTETFNTTQNYDSFSRINIMTYPVTSAYTSGFQVQRLYNIYGYLEKVQSTDAVPKVFWQGTEFNAQGQLITDSYANGVTTERDVNDATGWLNGTLVKDAALTSLYDASYSYDNVGNLSSRSDNRLAISETFGYDALDRVTSSQVTGQTLKNYTYDTLGNITSKTGIGSYTYGTCNAGPHAVCQAGNKTYQYDANGNMTLGAGRSVSYTVFNKPYQFTQGSTSVSFVYSADKSRMLKVAGTKRTRYVALGQSGGGLFEQTYDTATGNKRNSHYIFANSAHPIAQHVTEGSTKRTEYFHRDHLGSVFAITNDAGSVAIYKSHDPWGKRRNADWTDDTTGGLDTSHGNTSFTGHEVIPEIGLIHMNGRVYDPDLGRFLSADPHIRRSGDTQGYNRYSYVKNNPLSHTDPSGFFLKKLMRQIGRIGKTVHRVFKEAGRLVKNVRKGFNKIQQNLKNHWKPIAAAVLASYAGPWAQKWALGLQGATATTAAIVEGMVAGATFGAANVALHGGNLRDVVSAGIKGGISGAAFAAVNVSYGKQWGMGRVTVNGAVGGLSSVMHGGKFRDGFEFGFVTAGARYAYNKIVGFDATWESGGKANTEKGFTERPTKGANHVGNQGGDPESWLAEGQTLSKALNATPGVNNLAAMHDIFQISLPGVWRDILNFPGMVPAAQLSTIAVLNTTPYLMNDKYLH